MDKSDSRGNRFKLCRYILHVGGEKERLKARESREGREAKGGRMGGLERKRQLPLAMAGRVKIAKAKRLKTEASKINGG